MPEVTEAGNDQDERGRVESVDETPTVQDHRENTSDGTKTEVRQRNSVIGGPRPNDTDSSNEDPSEGESNQWVRLQR